MRKRDTWLWVIYGFVLLFLYLISSTDLLIKERKNEIYPVSVILDDTTDESYQNFKKGVDRAAIELNADVSMIRAVMLPSRSSGWQESSRTVRGH